MAAKITGILIFTLIFSISEFQQSVCQEKDSGMREFKADFKIREITGKWFLVARYSSQPITDDNEECSTLFIHHFPDNNYSGHQIKLNGEAFVSVKKIENDSVLFVKQTDGDEDPGLMPDVIIGIYWISIKRYWIVNVRIGNMNYIFVRDSICHKNQRQLIEDLTPFMGPHLKLVKNINCHNAIPFNKLTNSHQSVSLTNNPRIREYKINLFINEIIGRWYLVAKYSHTPIRNDNEVCSRLDIRRISKSERGPRIEINGRVFEFKQTSKNGFYRFTTLINGHEQPGLMPEVAIGSYNNYWIADMRTWNMNYVFLREPILHRRKKKIIKRLTPIMGPNLGLIEDIFCKNALPFDRLEIPILN